MNKLLQLKCCINILDSSVKKFFTTYVYLESLLIAEFNKDTRFTLSLHYCKIENVYCHMILGFQAYGLVQSNTLMLELDQLSLKKLG